MNLDHLRPTGADPESIRAALARTSAKADRTARELEAASRHRGVMLVGGPRESLIEAETRLAELKARRECILALAEELERSLIIAAPPSLEQQMRAAQAKASKAALAFGTWWEQRRVTVHVGLGLLAPASGAMAAWSQAQATAAAPPSKITPIRPSAPPASA